MKINKKLLGRFFNTLDFPIRLLFALLEYKMIKSINCGRLCKVFADFIKRNKLLLAIMLAGFVLRILPINMALECLGPVFASDSGSGV